MPAPRSVWDIERNDIAACVAFYDDRGVVTMDQSRAMLRLQDDPTELMDLMKSWVIVGPVLP